MYIVNNALLLHERVLSWFELSPDGRGSSHMPARACPNFGPAPVHARARCADWRLGRRRASRVYVRFQNFIFDYPVVAAWTLTLQNKVRGERLKPTEPEGGTTYTSAFIQHASPALGEH